MIVAANWKMNPLPSDSPALFAGYCADTRLHQAKAQVVCFVSACYLAEAEKAFTQSRIQWGAQNCYFEPSGAFTGEISADMIGGFGGRWVLVGHSERRNLLQETDEFVATKLLYAIKAGLTVVLCVGEHADLRQSGRHDDFVSTQILAGLKQFCSEPEDWQAAHLQQLVIAYEPVWAIGTGLTASQVQIQDMHAHIHDILMQQFAALQTKTMPPILYGGSVNQQNAKAIFQSPLVGGALVGGASLSSERFAEIVSCADSAI